MPDSIKHLDLMGRASACGWSIYGSTLPGRFAYLGTVYLVLAATSQTFTELSI